MRALSAVPFVLAVAVAALGGERVAAAQSCDPMYETGVLCQNPTPVCASTGLLTYGCQKCTDYALLDIGLGNNCPNYGGPAQTCETSGACQTSCTTHTDGGGADAGECPAALPYCTGTMCVQCQTSTPHDPLCPPTAPSCNQYSVCGCVADTDCSATPGAKCQADGGIYGAGVCAVMCSDDNGCATGNAHHCAVEGGADTDGSADGHCVECLATADCDAGQVCNTTAGTCFTLPVVDAGPPDSGAGHGADGGTTTTDGGVLADGGTSTRDATISDSGEVEGESDTYPPGKVEGGGGCSVLTPGAGGGSDVPVAPALLGFAGLAGLFFLRRAQRRSSQGHDERR